MNVILWQEFSFHGELQVGLRTKCSKYPSGQYSIQFLVCLSVSTLNNFRLLEIWASHDSHYDDYCLQRRDPPFSLVDRYWRYRRYCRYLLTLAAVEGSYHLSRSGGGGQFTSAWVLPVWNVASWIVVRCTLRFVYTHGHRRQFFPHWD
jgi:hypothetical protein